MKLEQTRKKIDQIDKKMLTLLSKRFMLAKRIGLIKQKIGKPVKDKNREIIIINNLMKKTGNLNLDTKFIKKIWLLIIKQSNKMQKRL